MENEIAEMEAQKVVADQREKQYEDQAAGLEAQKVSLEVLLKASNEQKEDIVPLTKQALFLINKISQM